MTAIVNRIDSGTIMSQATICSGVIYLAGQVARTANASVAVQAAEVLEKIDALLDKAGSDRSHLLSALIHLVDVADYAAMNAVWSAWVPEGKAPARTTVIAGLALPGLAIEITVVAAVKDGELA